MGGCAVGGGAGAGRRREAEQLPLEQGKAGKDSHGGSGMQEGGGQIGRARMQTQVASTASDESFHRLSVRGYLRAARRPAVRALQSNRQIAHESLINRTSSELRAQKSRDHG